MSEAKIPTFTNCNPNIVDSNPVPD
jgi:hypothetical protein